MESQENQKILENKQKIILELIKRFDTYIGAANTKIAIILSYSMAYIGGISFKIIDVKNSGGVSIDYLWWITIFAAGASVVATFFAAYKAYSALSPQTPSGRGENEEPSIIFFGDVANLVGGRDAYVNRVISINDADILRDLAQQSFVLASIVSKKMTMLKDSVKILIQVQLPISLVAIICLWITKA